MRRSVYGRETAVGCPVPCYRDAIRRPGSGREEDMGFIEEMVQDFTRPRKRDSHVVRLEREWVRAWRKARHTLAGRLHFAVRAQVKACYDNAAAVARLPRREWPELRGARYVEGLCTVRIGDTTIVDVPHAWVLLRDGTVVDVTLRPGSGV